MKILVVDEDGERKTILREGLQRAGHTVDSAMLPVENLPGLVAKTRPDVIIIDTNSPDRDAVEHVVLITQGSPRPIVMFSADNDTEKIRAAVRAGVSAYVVDGLSAERIQPIIDVAIARFEALQALRAELLGAQSELAARKTVEQAKGLLMKKKNIAEDEAFRLLRKMAMDGNLKLAQAAEQLVRASKLLL
ncbi:MAG: ANTAR domain-containing response regulator [Burkholderiales bacterium]